MRVPIFRLSVRLVRFVGPYGWAGVVPSITEAVRVRFVACGIGYSGHGVFGSWVGAGLFCTESG